MDEEIVNKVSKSKIKTIDLEEYYPKEPLVILDIKKWLFKGFILKEKEFRESLENHDWKNYKDTYVALCCSSEAIIPAWAYLLVVSYASAYSKKIVIGSLETLRNFIYRDIIEHINYKAFENKIVVVKGCSEKKIPENAYVFLIEKLRPVVRKIMYGEICSAVPLYKKK